MSKEEKPDRLLRESDLIALAKERFGITASKVIMMIEDCPETKAIEVHIPGERENGRTHNTGVEDKAETTP